MVTHPCLTSSPAKPAHAPKSQEILATPEKHLQPLRQVKLSAKSAEEKKAAAEAGATHGPPTAKQEELAPGEGKGVADTGDEGAEEGWGRGRRGHHGLEEACR